MTSPSELIIVPVLKKLLHILKKILPWAFALIIFWLLFRRYPLSGLIEATRNANLLFLLIFSIVYFLFIWGMDCWGLAQTLSRFGIPTKTRELLQVRAASYLVMILNYGAGQGILTFFLNRKKGIPFLKISSIILLITLVDLYWVITFAGIGSLIADPMIAGVALKRPIQLMWLTSTIGGIFLTILAHLRVGEKIPWFKNWSLFYVLHEGHVYHYLTALLERLPMHLVINSTLYILAWGFHSHLSIGSILSSVPIIMLVGTIPITPGGLGTVQVATVELLKNSLTSPLLTQGITREELLLSMSLYAQFSNYALKALFGSLHIRQFYSRKNS